MRMPWLWLGLCFVAMAAAVPAHAGDPGCSTPEIRRVAVPLDYGEAGGPTFDLAYRFRQGSGIARSLVIVLPGGPGATLMREDMGVSSGGIPSDFPVVLTDPRGAGCNDDPALTEDRYFTSEALARDVLAIVTALAAERRAPLDYILYGQSYGTVQATIAAALAARLGVTPPRAVVLEGTLGHAFANYAEHFAPFQAEWQSVRAELPEPWRRKFRDGTYAELSGADSVAWAHLIEHELIGGFRPDGEPVLVQQLARRGALMRMLTGPFAATPGTDQPGESRVLRVIACAELTGDLYSGRDLVGGDLVFRGRDACAGTGGLVRPYDAARWPVTVPLVYVQGEHDPATPLAQARYHFGVQREAPRWFLSIGRAAHAPLAVTLATGDCRERLWLAIAGKLERLPAAVKTCNDGLSQDEIRLTYRAADAAPATMAAD